MNSSHALAGHAHAFAAANGNSRNPDLRLAQLEAELAAHEPVVGAAILTAAAFRMRDEAGLIETLRLLVQAVGRLEAEALSADA